MKKTNKKGFTLVELVIVIAVLAILAAIAIPTIASILNNANQSASETNAHQAQAAINAYVAKNEANLLADDAGNTFGDACEDYGLNVDSVTQPKGDWELQCYTDGDGNVIVVSSDGETSVPAVPEGTTAEDLETSTELF